MRYQHFPRVEMMVLLATAAMAGAIGAQAQDVHPSAPSMQAVDEAPFLAENRAAMDRMMTDMDVKPTGDVDADFVAMMVPHHQGAIDMARAVLRYGRNEQIRRIAQGIIVEQQQEIVAMRLALGQPLPPSAPAPTQPGTPASGAPAPTAATSHHHSATPRDAMSMPPPSNLRQESHP
jgi:hypothetical protein